MEMLSGTCSNHPARAAVGICVDCRKAACVDCITKIDGINYCVACLAARAGRRGVRRAEVTRTSPAAYLGALVGASILTFLVWLQLQALFGEG